MVLAASMSKPAATPAGATPANSSGASVAEPSGGAEQPQAQAQQQEQQQAAAGVEPAAPPALRSWRAWPQVPPCALAWRTWSGFWPKRLVREPVDPRHE